MWKLIGIGNQRESSRRFEASSSVVLLLANKTYHKDTLEY